MKSKVELVYTTSTMMFVMVQCTNLAGKLQVECSHVLRLLSCCRAWFHLDKPSSKHIWKCTSLAEEPDMNLCINNCIAAIKFYKRT